MSYLVNLVIRGRPALVVGGGEIAARKVEDLLAAGARVTIVAPEACEALKALAQQQAIRAFWRDYEPGDIDGCFVVVASTDDEAVNARIARDAMERNVLVNVVDRPPLCTFTVPATVHRGDLTLAIATDGQCPALSSILREELESQIGDGYGALTILFAQLRRSMMALGWKGAAIREKLALVYRDGVMAEIAAGDRSGLEQFLRARLGPDFPLEPSAP